MKTLKELVVKMFTDKYLPWYWISILIVFLGAAIGSYFVVALGFAIQGCVVGSGFAERTNFEKEVKELKEKK